MRLLGRAAVVAGAGALVLSLVGCAPDVPSDGSSPSSAPSGPAATPSESEADQAERERGEHAIEVYGAASDELDRLLNAGADEPSQEFSKYAAGSYLEAAAGLLKQVSGEGIRTEGSVRRLDIWVSGTAAQEKVSLMACEDASEVRYVDENGDVVEGEDIPYTIQKAEVEASADGTWKVTYVESQGLDSLEGTECADAA